MLKNLNPLNVIPEISLDALKPFLPYRNKIEIVYSPIYYGGQNWHALLVRDLKGNPTKLQKRVGTPKDFLKAVSGLTNMEYCLDFIQLFGKEWLALMVRKT